MSKQVYDAGDVIQAGANSLEVTAVSYQEEGGEKVRFTYAVRLKSELDAERAAAAKAAEDAAAAEEQDGEA